MATNSKPLFTDTVSLMDQIKIEDVYELFINSKEMSGIVVIQPSQTIMIIQTN